jgi:hypothetical protein
VDLRKRRFNFEEGRLIPRKHYPPPFRLVGLGIIVMVVVLFILYKIFIG